MKPIRWLVALSLAVGSVLPIAAPAYACSCEERSAAEQAADATIAFVGQEINRREAPGRQWNTMEVRFQVDAALKGDLPGVVTVYTAPSGAECGVDSLQGRGQFGVLAWAGEEGLTIGLCGGVVGAAELAGVFGSELPPPVPVAAPPTEAPGRDLFPLLVLAGGLAALTGMVVAFRRRRPRVWVDGFTSDK